MNHNRGKQDSALILADFYLERLIKFPFKMEIEKIIWCEGNIMLINSGKKSTSPNLQSSTQLACTPYQLCPDRLAQVEHHTKK